MALGLALPQFDYSVPGENPLRWDTVVRWAQRAEMAGLSSVWLADHLFLELSKYGGDTTRYGAVDPLVGLGGLAAATETVRIGTLVMCAPLRHPALLAKAAAAIDRLSQGRLVLGLGAGWLEAEFAAAGVSFESPANRLAQLEEAVRVVKGLGDGGPFTFGGHWYVTDGARSRPPAVAEGGPPVWIGGKGGDRLLAVVAAVADGWNTVWRWTPDDYKARRDALFRACEDVGRDPASVTLSVGLTTLVAESETDLSRRYEELVAQAPRGTAGSESLAEFRRGRLVGTVEDVAAQLGEWRELGVAEVICSLGAVPFSVFADDSLELVASAQGKERRDG